MALKITLKPDEKIIINQAIITNGKHKADFYIENQCALLRTKDILSESQATTPSHVLYYLIQVHYLADDAYTPRKDQIAKLVDDIKQAAPSLSPHLDAIMHEVSEDNMYKALKNCDLLIQHEKEILKHAS